MESVTVFSPAKINLMLAVTGRRPDGYHDLVSVVAPLAFGDEVRLQRTPARGTVRLDCDRADVPAGEDNLAVRAARRFFAATGDDQGVAITLTKRTPPGAGLGGGSSNAAAVLQGLNRLANAPLDRPALAALALELGSDCPLFLAGEPCIMRGRGERIERLPGPARQRLADRRVLVFKPDFAIATPWAYARLAAAGAYQAAAAAEERLRAWLAGERPTSALLLNSFEAVVLRKFVVLSLLWERLARAEGVAGVLLSGSGSAGFALLEASADADALTAIVRLHLGADAFVTATTLA